LAGTIVAEATDAKMPSAMVHEAKGLDIEGPNALVLDSMEHDKEPNIVESDAGPEVL
jgi:hypothetical protein